MAIQMAFTILVYALWFTLHLYWASKHDYKFDGESLGVGFESTWDGTQGDIIVQLFEMMQLLYDITWGPTSTLENFLENVHRVFNVVIWFPHDHFGQTIIKELVKKVLKTNVATLVGITIFLEFVVAATLVDIRPLLVC